MQQASLEQMIWQAGFSFVCCIVFRFVGKWLLALAGRSRQQDGYATDFYAALAGIISVVVVYSVVMASFKTINVVLLFFFVLKRNGPHGSLKSGLPGLIGKRASNYCC
jgi:hypothetical protein